MALQAYLQTIDDLSPEIQEHYKASEADGGGFVLDAEGVQDVSGLKSALEKERIVNTQAKKFYGEHKDYDFSKIETIEAEYKQKLEAASGDSEKLAQLKTAYEGEKEQLLGLQNEEKESWKVARASLESTINTLMISDNLRSQVAAVAVDEHAQEFIVSALRAELEVVEDGEERSVRVKKSGGGHELTAGGNYKTIEDLVAERAKEPRFARLVKGSGNNGSGASNEGGGGSAQNQNPWGKESFNLTEQGRIMKKNPTLAAQLKAQA